MKKVKLFIIAITIIASYNLTAQVSVTNDGSSADASAMLDVKSTDKGMLMPRLIQSEIEAITNPANGLTVFNTNNNRFYFYDDVAGEWKEIEIGTGTITPGGVWACGDALVDSRDGQSYTTVQIGTQCWMAENLNIGTMINGSGEQSNNSTIEKFCYNNNTSNCDIYGGLYQWNEMMEYTTTQGTQGICPTAWHVPTDAEWCTLANYVDAGTISCSSIYWEGIDVGGNLKEAGTTHWTSPNTGATNSSGFTALGSGIRTTWGPFYYLNDRAYFWSSSENGSEAWPHHLVYSNAQILRYSYSKAYAFSVRCIQD